MQHLKALEVLGFNGDSNPTESDLKKAYRKAALKWHPDKVVYPEGATDEAKKALLAESEAKFIEVSNAYQQLLHPEKSRDNPDQDFFSNADIAKAMASFLNAKAMASFLNGGSMAQATADFMRAQGGFHITIATSRKSNYFHRGSSASGLGLSSGFEKQFLLILENGSKEQEFALNIFDGEFPEKTSKDYPKKIDKLIVDCIIKSPKVVDVTVKPGLFSAQQMKRLNKVLEKRKVERHKANLAKRQALNSHFYMVKGALLGLTAALLATLILATTGIAAIIGTCILLATAALLAPNNLILKLPFLQAGFLPSNPIVRKLAGAWSLLATCAAHFTTSLKMIAKTPLVTALVGLLIGGISGKLRYAYLEKCASYYRNDDPVSTESERQAILEGIEAKNWGGYFNSYKSCAAITHPVAFAAGMKFGIDDDTVELEKIKLR